MTSYTGIKFKFKTLARERDLELLEFITIDILKLEQQYTSSQDIITLLMNTIINIYFTKHPVSWDIIHHRLLHPYDSVIKAMCHNQTLYGIPKYL